MLGRVLQNTNGEHSSGTESGQPDREGSGKCAGDRASEASEAVQEEGQRSCWPTSLPEASQDAEVEGDDACSP